MRVRSETVVENRTISVELDADDGAKEFGAKWEDWSNNIRFLALSTKADLLVVFYLAQGHLVDPEYAKKRMTELQDQLKKISG